MSNKVASWRDRAKRRAEQTQQIDVSRPSGISVPFDEYFGLFCMKLDRNFGELIDLQEFRKYYPISAEFFSSRIDTNGNTTIQKKELRSLFVTPDGTNNFDRLVSVSNELQSRMIEEFTQCFDRLCDIVDQNNDSVISLDEFRYLHQGAAQQFFAELDMNDDGVLSKAEFKQMFLLKQSGLYDLLRIRELTESMIKRIEKDFKQEFTKFLEKLGFGESQTELDFTSFKKSNEKAFEMLFSLLEMESTDKMHVDELKAQFFKDGKTPDILVLREVESNLSNFLKQNQPLDIAFGWNSFSRPFSIYEEKSKNSKKIYSGVRGEEIYVNDVGQEWIKVSSPIPGWIQVLQSDLKHVTQVKQFITEEVAAPAVSEGGFKMKPIRTPTLKNLVCATNEDDKFVFPHGEKFEIEFGWYQTLPYGLQIFQEDKKSILYTMVSGEELHIVERQGQWVKLDSPMEGFFKVTDDNNRVVIKQIRNFITAITEKLTKKGVEKHEKVKESRQARKNVKKGRFSILPPKWIEPQPMVTVHEPEVPDMLNANSVGGALFPEVSMQQNKSRRPGLKTMRATDTTLDFFGTIAEMAENRRKMRQLEEIAQMLQERQNELQNAMLDEFAQLKNVASEKEISMEEISTNVKHLLHGHPTKTTEAGDEHYRSGAEDVKPTLKDAMTEMDTLRAKLEMLKEQAAKREAEQRTLPEEILEQKSLRFLRDVSDRCENFRSETSTFNIEDGSLPKIFYS